MLAVAPLGLVASAFSGSQATEAGPGPVVTPALAAFGASAPMPSPSSSAERSGDGDAIGHRDSADDINADANLGSPRGGRGRHLRCSRTPSAPRPRIAPMIDNELDDTAATEVAPKSTWAGLSGGDSFNLRPWGDRSRRKRSERGRRVSARSDLRDVFPEEWDGTVGQNSSFDRVSQRSSEWNDDAHTMSKHNDNAISPPPEARDPGAGWDGTIGQNSSFDRVSQRSPRNDTLRKTPSVRDPGMESDNSVGQNSYFGVVSQRSSQWDVATDARHPMEKKSHVYTPPDKRNPGASWDGSIGQNSSFEIVSKHQPLRSVTRNQLPSQGRWAADKTVEDTYGRHDKDRTQKSIRTSQHLAPQAPKSRHGRDSEHKLVSANHDRQGTQDVRTKETFITSMSANQEEKGTRTGHQLP